LAGELFEESAVGGAGALAGAFGQAQRSDQVAVVADRLDHGAVELGRLVSGQGDGFWRCGAVAGRRPWHEHPLAGDPDHSLGGASAHGEQPRGLAQG
jgi:hypothetical protein